MGHVEHRQWGPRVAAAVLALMVAVAGCGSSGTPSATRTTAVPTTTSVPQETSSGAGPVPNTVGAKGTRLALGTDNPAAGDCTTGTKEAPVAVGYVVIKTTAGIFQASIPLQTGKPGTTFGVFMQQVPGSCPQEQPNGGTLTTGPTGSANFVATVPRVAGATTFFVQLVNGDQNLEYTSDRTSRTA